MMEEKMFSDGLFGDGELTPFEEDGYQRWTPGTASKCDFCSQRVDADLDPACVVTCPTEARIFGDLDDPQSAPNQLLNKRGGGRQPLVELGTKPKVYYVD
jgi:molybdopterin-containing oxidoreductase family iron-sulfur binding subunit